MRWPRPSIPDLLRRLRRCRRGAAAVEFALVAPAFLIMTLGMVEAGRALWIKNTLQYACEQATRWALVNGSATTGDVENYAASQVPGLKGIDAGSFTAATEASGGATLMTVTATYNFTSLVPLVPIPDITLNARSSVPVS